MSNYSFNLSLHGRFKVSDQACVVFPLYATITDLWNNNIHSLLKKEDLSFSVVNLTICSVLKLSGEFIWSLLDIFPWITGCHVGCLAWASRLYSLNGDYSFNSFCSGFQIFHSVTLYFLPWHQAYSTAGVYCMPTWTPALHTTCDTAF